MSYKYNPAKTPKAAGIARTAGVTGKKDAYS